jgi:hypothetical protein
MFIIDGRAKFYFYKLLLILLIIKKLNKINFSCHFFSTVRLCYVIRNQMIDIFDLKSYTESKILFVMLLSKRFVKLFLMWFILYCT